MLLHHPADSTDQLCYADMEWVSRGNLLQTIDVGTCAGLDITQED